VQHELSAECERRFRGVENDYEKLEKRVRDLEKFQVGVVTCVGVANFVWIYFISPALK
jgi:hypothetical protein